jgi:cytoskeletal protein CcmA (bactofilin family)
MVDIQSDLLDEEEFDTIVSSDIDFSGVIYFDKPSLIKGKVKGEIIAEDLLVIEEAAVVVANIKGSRIIIYGKVEGDVEATDRVELTATGTLIGDVQASEMTMETGCVFNGVCIMPKTKKVE